ncbi:MAG: MFS transporter, partial [Alphaproteobacteria bacterium]
AKHDVKILGLIGSGHFLSHFYMLCLPPLFVVFKKEFGVSYTELGLLLSVREVITGSLQLPMGILVDRIGARSVLTIGLLMMSVGIGLMAFADSYWMLMAFIALMGLGSSTFHPADFTILNSTIASSRMGRAFSLHSFSGQIGTASAPAVIIFLTTMINWRAALLVVSGIGIAVAFTLIAQWSSLDSDAIPGKRSPAKDQARDEAKNTDAEGTEAGKPAEMSVLAIILSKPLMIFLLFYAMTSLTSSGIQAFSVVAMIDLYKTPLGMASGALTGFLLASAAGVLMGGVIADRTKRHDVIAALAFIATAVIIFIIGAVSLPYVLLVFAMTLAGLLQGVIRPSRDMMVRQVIPKSATGRAFGFVNSGSAIGGVFAPLTFGVVLDQGHPEWVFYLLAIFMALSVVTAIVPKGSLKRD